MIKGHFYCTNCHKNEDETNKPDVTTIKCPRCTHPMEFIVKGNNNPENPKTIDPVYKSRFLPS